METLIDDGEGRMELESGLPVPTGWQCTKCKNHVVVKTFDDQMRVYCNCIAIGLGQELHTYRKKGIGFTPRKIA